MPLTPPWPKRLTACPTLVDHEAADEAADDADDDPAENGHAKLLAKAAGYFTTSSTTMMTTRTSTNVVTVTVCLPPELIAAGELRPAIGAPARRQSGLRRGPACSV